MKVDVKLFAAARELTGQQLIAVEVSTPATVGDVRTSLLNQCPVLKPILAHALFAVNASYASDDTPISGSSEIACIPPVSGG